MLNMIVITILLVRKGRLLEKLIIPDSAFDQASRLNVGMQFENWNHANLVLLAYGQQIGFVWRIQDKFLDKNGGVYKYVFECRHAGKFKSKKTATDPSKQRKRESIKTECTCFINMCWPLKSQSPSITKMNLTHHGHSLNPKMIQFANVYRQLPQTVMDKIKFYVNTIHGINQHTLRQLLQGEFKDHLFLDRDLANAIQQFRKGDTDSERDPENDASNLLKELQKMKENDPTWFITYHCVKNRLFHLFWMTPCQQTLYLRYHDVILTDNTARTNKYHLSLCLFVGVDEHHHSRLVAQALMSDETTSSYMWVLNNFLVATNNLAPKMIFSDCDTGLEPAIETVFPTTRHLHCIFHIVLNIKKNLMRSLGSQFTAFQNDFFVCRNTLFEEVFESRFNSLCTNFPEASSYLKNILYPIKKRWAKCFTYQVMIYDYLKKIELSQKSIINGYIRFCLGV